MKLRTVAIAIYAVASACLASDNPTLDASSTHSSVYVCDEATILPNGSIERTLIAAGGCLVERDMGNDTVGCANDGCEGSCIPRCTTKGTTTRCTCSCEKKDG